MQKKEWFNKNINYNEQLEAILEEKNFSISAKNILLSMLYKIENTYEDYESVKRNVENKKDIIEEILKIIENCEEIEIAEPNSNLMKKLKKTKKFFRIDKKNRKIITLPNEKILLNALYELSMKKSIYINEDYSEIRKSLPYIIEKGKNLGKSEIIRDFDGWAWNTDFTAINNIECNLIYQNLEALLGRKFMMRWTNLDKSYNAIEVLKEELEKYLSKEDIDIFIKSIFKISIIIYCKIDSKEKNRLLEELEYNTQELEKLKKPEKLINELSNEKIKSIKEFEKIENILKNKQLFSKELKNYNKKQTKEEELTEADLENKLKKRKRKIKSRIKEIDGLLNPKKFANYKENLERTQELLYAINEENEKYIMEIQKYFIKGMMKKVISCTDKKQLLELAYILRYYNFVPFDKNVYIKDVPELKKQLDEIQNFIIEKMQEQKIVNKFSDSQKFDEKLIKKVFELRTIEIENINIQFEKGDKTKIIFYDEATIEKGFEVKINNIKILKYNKRIWMFS